MPNDPPSPEAMRAAKEIDEKEEWVSSSEHRSLDVTEIATIIDREMQPKWIKCSDRMPTEEDSGRLGNVIVGNTWAHSPVSIIPWHSPEMGEKWTHWQPDIPDPEPEDGESRK